MGELEAFQRFASAYPDECVLLVDTIDVLTSGVPNAVEVFKELLAAGHKPGGIRIDSGDLAFLAIQSAVLLNDAGFGEVPIVLSSDLDELVIWQILSQIETEAPGYGISASSLINRLIFGVGTRLITSQGDPSLGGVYKLVAVADERGDWAPAIKVSEDVEKIPIPGDKTVYRLYDNRGLATADVVALADEQIPRTGQLELFHPHRDAHRVLNASELSEVEELMQTVFENGKQRNRGEDIDELRQRRAGDLDRLHPGVRRLVNPHIYHVSLTPGMKKLQRDLVAKALGDNV
jgi:nicotinate phosphoribosyltransferase